MLLSLFHQDQTFESTLDTLHQHYKVKPQKLEILQMIST